MREQPPPYPNYPDHFQVDCVMKCPYCGKQKDILRAGAYRCTRCTGRFQVSENLSITKAYFDYRWRAASIGTFVLACVIFLFIHLGMHNGPLRERLENVTAGTGGFLFVLFDLVQSLKTGIL